MIIRKLAAVVVALACVSAPALAQPSDHRGPRDEGFAHRPPPALHDGRGRHFNGGDGRGDRNGDYGGMRPGRGRCHIEMLDGGHRVRRCRR